MASLVEFALDFARQLSLSETEQSTLSERLIEEFDSFGQRVLAPDQLRALARLAVVTRLNEISEEALTDAVQDARELGLSWTFVGRATRMTQQSAHQRWAKLKPSSP